MRVLAVAQAFKGSLTLGEVADALSAGIRRAGAAATVLPGSDGGDGLLDALASRLIRRTRHETADPFGRRIDAAIGWLDPETAVVESRLACGLALLREDERDPRRATSRGVGVLINAAREAGARTVFVGLGGSATMDGGTGMARVWGWVPRGAEGQVLPEGGGPLERVTTMDAGRRPDRRIVGLADVTSPLLGADGARRFAAQKGASPDEARRLERGLARLVAATDEWGGEAAARRPGAGAAGGLGFGLIVFAGADLTAGAPWVLDRIGWHDALATAELVLVAEAAFDGTSDAGKLTGEVLRRAERHGARTVLVAPTVQTAPRGVTVESGDGGWWDAGELARRAEAAVRRALRLPRP